MSISRTDARSVRRWAVAMGIVALASALSAQAPQSRGTISGTVRDPVGAAAPKVVVQARGADGQVHRATTDNAGKYTLTDLPPGAYDVSITIPGLKAFDRPNVQVTAAGAIVVDIKLEEGTQLSTLGEDP